MDVMEALLAADIPSLPEKSVKLKRLSELTGQDIIFRLRALPYNRANEITRLNLEDTNVHIVLAGTVSPDLKDAKLLDKYGVPTPDEVLKKMLLPGEIEDLSREIEKLSGYRKTTIETVEDIKKK